MYWSRAGVDRYSPAMQKNRLEAFSDGVIAIIITIMVLGLPIPEHGKVDWADLKPVLPVFFSYVLSYVYVGIYWNNHHHMLHATKHHRHKTRQVLWANLHLLFWLSLFPVCNRWMGENWLEKNQPTERCRQRFMASCC